MKKLVFIALCIVTASSLKAQDTASHKMMHHQMHHEMKDCVMMENGKMMQMTAGKTAPLSTDLSLSDGSIVMPNGTLKKKDGSTVALKNGDCVMMDGTMKKMAMDGMRKKK